MKKTDKDKKEELIASIQKLKKEKNAIIVAHLYQPLEIQLIADMVGDSFELAKKCVSSDCAMIVFCGVSFMGESAKILSKEKRVFVPAENAKCAMADMLTAEDVKELKRQHPDAAAVCYINSTAEVKAACDMCCTSSNALKAVGSLKEKKIIFVPDRKLGRYIASKMPEKEFVFFEGYCPVHNDMNVDSLKRIKARFKEAPVLMHPECTEEAANLADFLGSTSQIIDFVDKSDKKEFIIATETGVVERLAMLYPDKKFYLADRGLVCPDMKKCSLESIYDTLKNESGEITLDAEITEAAGGCLRRMMAL